ncbi:MAG: hypothetical protein SD837_01730 [Candidatus Electrothrix scaldis]|nr:MAG: hypothetical protein SD837_01730 [Candidatus Electrothrix sp. GW3-3]
MKRLLYTALAIFLVVTATAAQAEVQGRRFIGGELAGRLRAEPFKTDLRVNGIYGVCACDLPEVDALYMGEIDVWFSIDPYVKNGVLKVTYYDLMKQKEITVIKDVAELPSTNSSNYPRRIVDTPVLVKRTKGIRVEITPKNNNIIDQDYSNNVKVVHSCETYIE